MDAHEKEYDAAAAAMRETYGAAVPAVGDWVNGIAGRKRWGGRVLAVMPDGRVQIDVDGAVLEIGLSEITRV